MPDAVQKAGGACQPDAEAFLDLLRGKTPPSPPSPPWGMAAAEPLRTEEALLLPVAPSGTVPPWGPLSVCCPLGLGDIDVEVG